MIAICTHLLLDSNTHLTGEGDSGLKLITEKELAALVGQNTVLVLHQPTSNLIQKVTDLKNNLEKNAFYI